MNVAIMFLTLNRSNITKKCIDENLTNSGWHSYNTYVADNGSNEVDIITYVRNRGFTYTREFGENIGVAKAFNHLIKRAYDDGCDSFVFLGNDISMQKDWLKIWIDHHKHYGDETGIVGVECAIPPCPISTYKNLNIHKIETGDRVFGCWYVPRLVIDRVGYFFEYPGPYGIEDSDYNERVSRSGFTSFYIDNSKYRSKHLCNDVGENSEYRKMKNESLFVNVNGFTYRWNIFYKENKKLYHNPFKY